jgi:hypothetical protein
MAKVRLYIEGGGDRTSQRALRQGFNAFLARLIGRDVAGLIDVTMAGSRENAFRAWRLGREDHAEDVVVLLVDSEAEVTGAAHEHLQAQDGWEGLADRCHLMVQVMETWLVADPEALEAFYKAGFRPRKLPGRDDLEQVPKQDVLNALKDATAGSTKGTYHKSDHAPRLLAAINPEKVRQRARHCIELGEALVAWTNEA